MPGKLIVFEGPDGVGKSTMVQHCADHLAARQIQHEVFSFPGKTHGTLGLHVYRLHHEAKQTFGIDSVHPASLQTLHVAAHIDAIESRILPALRNGLTVLLDRFWWSTWVYGLVSGVPRPSLEAMVELEKVHWADQRPDTILVIRSPRPIRSDASSTVWPSLLKGYDELLVREQRNGNVRIIRNDGDEEECRQQVIAAVQDVLHARVSRRRRQPRSPSAQSAPAMLFKDKERTSAQDVSPTVLSRWTPAKPTVVYDTYWRFAVERQAIFFRRLRGARPPWTDDSIMQRFKFTNAYRASDRVSQFLIHEVLYAGDQSPAETFFRTLLFKMFNKIETWELLTQECGTLTYADYSFERYDRVLNKALERGHPIYSAAYIMPSGTKGFASDRKHRSHLRLIEQMMKDCAPARIFSASTMRDAFELMKSYPMMGDFLAYQIVTDLNYSALMDFSETSFVVPGPGAKEGIHKCFRELGGLNEVDVISFVTDRQQEEFERLGLDFQSLWGRPLQLIDCQNLFCEVAKYARMAHPAIDGASGRTRIKQIYRMNPTPIQFWYPPKWKINERVRETIGGLDHDSYPGVGETDHSAP
jgi:thymidylate kinase